MAEDTGETGAEPQTAAEPHTAAAPRTAARAGSEAPFDIPLERLIEETLLGGPTTYDRTQVAERAGMPVELAVRIWQALGFPTPPDDAVAFTEEDSEALRDIQELLGSEFVDEDMVLDLARAVGQTMGRLASWLGDVWLRQLADHLLAPGERSTDETVAAALLATSDLRPRFEHLLLQGWRRQLAAVGIRAMATSAAATADPATGSARVSVGFADVVSFTKRSRRMDGQSLADFVEHFERSSAEIVTELGGRVVKTLGDEILFVADDPRAAAEIGLQIAERGAVDTEFPEVRVGLAAGEVILRLGDVFGTPVNLAARLTSVAYPGSVLIDPELARTLIADRTYETRPLPARPLQGLGKVRPWVLRRPDVRSGRGDRSGRVDRGSQSRDRERARNGDPARDHGRSTPQ